jgi:ribonuclease HI
MYVLYTDGSCLGNPGRGGWAARCIDLFDISGGEKVSTNNAMEMTAIAMGIEKCLSSSVGQSSDVRVFTDSQYVINGMTTWIRGWKKKGWKTASGTPVKNKELWMKLDALAKKCSSIEFHWVKAHDGNINNEFVDTEARRQASMIK